MRSVFVRIGVGLELDLHFSPSLMLHLSLFAILSFHGQSILKYEFTFQISNLLYVYAESRILLKGHLSDGLYHKRAVNDKKGLFSIVSLDVLNSGQKLNIYLYI